MFKAKYCAMVLAALAVFAAAAMPATAKELSATYKSSDSAQVSEQRKAGKINEATASSTTENTSSISYSQRKAEANEKQDPNLSNAVQTGTFITQHN